MSAQRVNEVTGLLAAANAGQRDAMSRLAEVVYDELRALAGDLLRHQPAGATLRTTALVHEAYLRLVDQTQVAWEGRSHFFAVAAKAMRHILVDHARRRGAAKRGGGAQRVPLDDVIASLEDRDVNLVDLDEALDRLTAMDERKGRIVELRFFAGLDAAETARLLDVSTSTVERDWRLARAWLHRELTGIADSPAAHASNGGSTA